jgi:hypothetical protein
MRVDQDAGCQQGGKHPVRLEAFEDLHCHGEDSTSWACLRGGEREESKTNPAYDGSPLPFIIFLGLVVADCIRYLKSHDARMSIPIGEMLFAATSTGDKSSL